MHANEKNICRLCFANAGNGYENIDNVKKEIFDVLFIKLNLDIGEKAIICRECAATLVRCLYFKSTCVRKEKQILRSTIDNAATKLKTPPENIENKTNYDITSKCIFCMNPAKNDISSIGSMNKSLIVEMLPVFFPEKNFHSTTNYKSCSLCSTELEVYLTFLFKCNMHETNKNRDQLFQLQHFLLENGLELHNKNYRKDPNGTFPCDLCPYVAKRENNIKSHMLKHKDVSEVDMFKCEKCSFETKWKSSLRNHMVMHGDASEVLLYKCSFCTYETKWKPRLRDHMLVHGNELEVKKFKCPDCKYETKWKSSLNNHMATQHIASDLKKYKCPSCAYETKWSSSLKNHMTSQHDAFDVKTYKCSNCKYETKSKSSLTSHMVVHRKSSEVKKFKCSKCEYETKWRSSLRNHVLVHLEKSEVVKYKCLTCTYETKWKSSVKKHMAICKKEK